MHAVRRRGAVAAVALGAALASLVMPAAAQGSTAPQHTGAAAQGSWAVDLDAATADRANTAFTAGRLTLHDLHAHPAAQPAGRSYGEYTAPVTALGGGVSALTVRTTATRPAGSAVDTDVRGRDASGGWTQWTTAAPGAVVAFAAPVAAVQVRVVLSAPAAAPAPAVSAVRLDAAAPSPGTGRAAAGARPRTAAPAATATYRVYATREGLVGGTTANGHVIANRDHFVALPSRRLLDANGSRTYQVTVCNGSRCETAPIWDVGPWNTTDDYWNPSGVRESWGNLPQGTPEAQAAYQSGYNGGHDQFGRAVANPAGIDLADGTFWDGLGMTGNGWVTVSFSVAAPPPTTKYWVDTYANAPVYASPTSTAQTGTLYGGTDYVYCKAWGRMIGTSTSYNHWWLRTDPDTGPAKQYVSAYYLSRWGNDEAKDNNGTVIPDC
ncbi:SH3 domain-containing protein [Streptomyces sp. V4-01]|uniref:SH3 domain-containing protein n=1 Tax=Actinacidiphila polyblastidii TaxID=3110430 RepID=A0ABU7PDQ0_9ACTN|nr:SH3 domain-containing protein [Streptomyces sp. V4-01]